jgi:hypothetical protein
MPYSILALPHNNKILSFKDEKCNISSRLLKKEEDIGMLS